MKQHIYLLTFLFLFITLQTSDAQTTKRVLIEKFTSSNCGNCPDGIAMLYNLTASHPDAIWVSIHAGWINDPMRFPTIDTIANDFTSGAPKANFDRIKFQNESEVATNRSNWSNHLTQQETTTSEVDVQISGINNGTSADVTVTANFLTTPTSGDFRINLYVIEDSLVGSGSNWNQANYFNSTMGHFYQGAGNPIANYPHRNVVRAIPSHAWGTAGVIPNAPMTNMNYSKTYTVDLSNYTPEKVRFVAFVSYYNADPNQRSVLNANKVTLSNLVTSTKPKTTLPVTLQLTPNPATDIVNININTEQPIDGQLSIYNIFRKTCFTSKRISLTYRAKQPTAKCKRIVRRHLLCINFKWLATNHKKARNLLKSSS